MTYTARQLIVKSYNLSQIVSKDFQTVSGSQITDGLFLLNELLAIKSVDKGNIPYFKEFVLTPVVGQEKYFIENLVELQSSTFNLGNIRVSMEKKTRKEFFATSRVDGIQSYTLTYHIERTVGGSNLYVYFVPLSTEYPIKLWGKFGFPQIADLDEDLSESYDMSYLGYLRYLLAEYICHENTTPVSDQVQSKIASYDAMFKDISPYDFSRNTILPFGGQGHDALTEGLINQRFGPWR